MTSPEDIHLIKSLSIQSDHNTPGHIIASQQAKIGDRTVTIRLHFSQSISQEQAEEQMRFTLEKITDLDPNLLSTSSESSSETSTAATKLSQVEISLEKIEEISSGLVGLRPNKIVIETHRKLPIPPFSSSPQKISSRKSTTGAKGKHFKDEFRMGFRRVATEKAARADNVPLLTKSLETKISKLEAKLAQLEALNGNTDLVKKALEKAKGDLEKYNVMKNEATWGSTNTPRFAFSEMGRSAAKEQLAPVLCNHRLQTVETPQGEVVSSITRSAAMTDFSHGEVSLQELKDLPDLEQWQSLSNERKAELRSLYLTDSKTLNATILEIKAKALTAYGVEALTNPAESSGKLEAILHKLQNVSSIAETLGKLSPQEQFILKGAVINPEKLEKVMSDRRDKLKLLALQDLQLHLQSNPAKNDPLLYSRVSLVDLRKRPTNEKGLMLDERTQGLDMKALFEELEGATLLFDCEEGEASYIDEEGEIHMSKNCAQTGTERTTLSTSLINVCTQGDLRHTMNTGMQKTINENALEKLRAQYGQTEEFISLENGLKRLSNDPQYDPNEVVLLATLFFQKQGGYTGINCFGGKDRTGYAVALVTHHHVLNLSGKKREDPEAKEWGHQLLSKTGIASNIAQDNADHTALKLSRKDLLLYDIHTVKGKMLRGADAAQGIFAGVEKSLKSLFKKSQISASDSPGQLYKPSSIKATHLTKFKGMRKIKSLAKHLKSIG